MMISFDVFKYGKRNALTLSYDDAPACDIKLIEIFNKYGIKSTFHINSGLLDDDTGWHVAKKDIKEVYKGHEISAHGLCHRPLTQLPSQNIIPEIIDNRRELECLCDYPVRGLSYANGFYNDEVISALRTCGIEYSRTAKSSNNFLLPQDFLEWHPTCHHNDALEMSERFLNANHYQGKLFYVWGHSFEFDRNKNWDLIEAFCKIMSNCKDVWFATNIEIYDYVTAQRSLKISVDNKLIYNPSYQSVWIMIDGECCEVKGGKLLRL